MQVSRVWIVLAVIYAAFFGWYTSFGGPLSDEEVTHFMTLLAERGGLDTDLERWRQFMQTDTGDDFAMWNALDLRDQPLQVEGVEPGDSSADVMSRYSTPFMGLAARAAAHPVMIGTAAGEAVDVWGIEGAENWTAGALVRYRSRRDLMNLAVQVGPSGVHDFKTAALQKTIAFPLDPWFQLGDPRFVLALILLVIGLAWDRFRGADPA